MKNFNNISRALGFLLLASSMLYTSCTCRATTHTIEIHNFSDHHVTIYNVNEPNPSAIETYDRSPILLAPTASFEITHTWFGARTSSWFFGSKTRIVFDDSLNYPQRWVGHSLLNRDAYDWIQFKKYTSLERFVITNADYDSAVALRQRTSPF